MKLNSILIQGKCSTDIQSKFSLLDLSKEKFALKKMINALVIIMVRYCSCYRDIGFSNRTSVVRNAAGEEICSHCGGVVPPARPYNYDPYENPDGLKYEDNHVSASENFRRQAKASSVKGDHASAIGFYKEALRSKIYTDCEVLSYIAEEYEAMGDYASSEEYWMRCCAVKRDDSYKYISMKGDFLYRRERYEEAIGAYEDALRMLEEVDDRDISLAMLKYHARITHFIIYSYNAIGKGNREEKYHNELKREIERFLRSRWSKGDEVDAHNISETAWEIYEDGRMTDEALILIDAAINLHPDDDCYHRKAIFIKDKLKIKLVVNNITTHDLELIDEALRMLPDDVDNGPYLRTKGEILDQLGDPVKAWVCYALAAKDYSKVEEAERQLKRLKPTGTYINITGIHNYQHFAPFREGTVVDLVREPDNPHDSFAIRVEIGGETVGYVANSRYTLIKEVKSARDIKDSNATQAIVQFILFGKWVVAKLI